MRLLLFPLTQEEQRRSAIASIVVLGRLISEICDHADNSEDANDKYNYWYQNRSHGLTPSSVVR